MLTSRFVAFAIAVCAVGWLHPSRSLAQEAPAAAPSSGPQRIITGPNGQKMIVRPGQPPMPIGGSKPSSTPSKPDDKKKEDPKKKDGDKKDDKADEKKVVTRPTEPPSKPNPDELKVKPDDDGLLQFNFRYQPWPDVLDWLAGVSHMSLDWQELPGGFLNLSTQRPYSVEEARDLINRHLLARGYTLLLNDGDLSVAKTAEINSAMVPRVTEEQLQDLMPHEFAKVSFRLDWLLAEQAVEELTPMKSPNGKLTALKTTNRIEAMDAAVNLREIYQLLQQEQSDAGQDNLIKEFELQHARASDVMTSLQELLGLESKKPSMPMSPQQMQQMQQQMMQQMQRSSSRSSSQQKAAAPKPPGEVHLIVNARKNSVVAHAPPDKMAIIEKAVEALDVKSSHRDGILNQPFQIHAYRLHSLSPEPLVKTLQDVGELDPNTRLEADASSKSIIAYASLTDHAKIQQLIDNLDGSGRQFEVMPLRRLAADYVAGTIEFMMIGDKEEKQQPRYFSYYSSRYGNNEDQGDDDEFRVDADVENNILLLWANEVEIKAVHELLVKLGEIPPEGGRSSTMRVLNVMPTDDAGTFLDRLRKAWPSLAPNELQLPDLPEPEPDAEEEPTPEVTPPEGKEVRTSIEPARTVFTSVEAAKDEVADDKPAEQLPATEEVPNTEASGDAKPKSPPSREELRRMLFDNKKPATNASPPPVNIAIDHAGRLVITSQDTGALDMLEELITQLAPPTPDYKIFKLQYVDAYYVKDNLEDFFAEEEDDDKNTYRRYYYYDYAPQNEEKARSRLSQRPKLKFIYDYDSNSILVQGASATQLKTIEELIAIYDQAETDESQSARFSATFQIQYSKASVIAEAIKEVYRDLLSSNDKALAQNNPEAKNRQPSGTTYIFNDGEGGDKPDRTHVSFKGKLSLGIDEVSNILLVSAEGEQLMTSVSQMIETLDEAAKPVSTVSVVQLGGNVNAEKVRAVLMGLLGEKQAPQQQNPQNGQPNGQRPNQGRGNNQQNGGATPVAK